MDPNLATLTPPPCLPEPPTGTGFGDPATAWESGQDVSPLTATSAPGSGDHRTVATFSPHFTEGQVVAGRYRVLGFVARGGMGEVYEGLDLDLNERLAMKVLSREQSQSDEALQRFKRELSLARKVTHPNVCRTYDFFQHVDPSGERISCLSMELLRGETLSQRLGREGRMDPALVRNLAQQMAAGLEAAHAAGVVHRDLKPSNIMLVKGSSGETSLRAVITDFGLAFSQENIEKGSQRFLGTPAYMSPEQVEYLPITPRSDIYSLGLVIFEMLTGRVAFQGSNAISAATRRLKEPPPEARLFVPDLDPFWEGVLAKCLALKPEDRYGSAAELVGMLDPPPAALPLLPVRRSGQVLILATAITTLVIAGGAFGAWRTVEGKAPWSRSMGFIPRRPTIAVLGFKNLGPQEGAWRGTALAEMLGTELGVDEKLRIIGGEEISRMKKELGIHEDQGFDKALLGRIRSNLGTDFLVTGSFVDTGRGGFRVDLRLVDAKSGEVISTMRKEGQETELLNLVHGAGQDLRFRLGFGERPKADQGHVLAAFPKDAEGMRLYVEALAKLRSFETQEAVALLEQALSKDANCALVHSALSEAWAQLGFDGRAKNEARAAVDCSRDLSREDQLRLRAQNDIAHDQWIKASESFETLLGLFPDRVDYWLGYVNACKRAGRFQEAQVSISRLRRLSKDLMEDSRIDLEAASLAQQLNRLAECRSLAIASAAKADSRGAKFILARARLLEGIASQGLGDSERARDLLTQSVATFKTMGDLGSAGSGIRYMVALNTVQGDFSGARKLAEDAVGLAIRANNLKAQSSALLDLGWLDWEEGRYKEAKARQEESLILLKRLELPTLVAHAQVNLAYLQLEMGGPIGNGMEAGLPNEKTLGQDHLGASVLAFHGRQALEQGDLQRALSHLTAAQNRLGPDSDEQTRIFNNVQLARVLRAEGEVERAKATLQFALRIAEKMKAKPWMAGVHVELALLLLDEGQPAEALVWAGRALQAYREMGTTEGVARTSVLMAGALAGLGRLAEADAALPKGFRSESLEWRTQARLWGVRLGWKSKRVQTQLKEARKDVASAGNVPLQLEIRLVEGELAIRIGRIAQGVTLLRKLEAEASEKGFGGLARRTHRIIQETDSNGISPRNRNPA